MVQEDDSFYNITNSECEKWLLGARNRNSDFGIGAKNIETKNHTDGLLHIVNTVNKQFFCKKKSTTTKEILSLKYIDIWLSKTLCPECDKTFDSRKPREDRNVGLQLTNLAYMCIWADKISLKPPEKYSKEWQKTIRILALLKEYRHNDNMSLCGVLVNELKDAEIKLAAYLNKNPTSMLDNEFFSMLRENKENIDYPIAVLLGWKEELERSDSATIPNNALKAIEEITGDLTKIVRLDKTEHFSFKKWVLEEVIKNKVKSLKKEYEKYLQEISNIKKYGAQGPQQLIKLPDYFSVNAKIHAYFYGLKRINTSNKNGVLVPKAILCLLEQKQRALPEGSVILGEVLESDTIEIIETALKLEAPAEKALPMARLLHK